MGVLGRKGVPVRIGQMGIYQFSVSVLKLAGSYQTKKILLWYLTTGVQEKSWMSNPVVCYLEQMLPIVGSISNDIERIAIAKTSELQRVGPKMSRNAVYK